MRMSANLPEILVLLGRIVVERSAARNPLADNREAASRQRPAVAARPRNAQAIFRLVVSSNGRIMQLDGYTPAIDERPEISRVHRC
jgi:hypothetical protein